MPGDPPLSIGKGRHWLVAGENGSGKTFWLQNWFCPQPKRQIVWDTEDMEYPDEIWPEASVHQAARMAADRLPFRVRIRAPAGPKGSDMFDDLSRRLLAHGHDAAIVVDEYADLSNQNYVSRTHRDYIRKARKRNLVNVFATQRPQEIPKTTYTQAIHHVFFYLEEADVFFWKPKARYLPDLMPKIPFESFRWIYHHPKIGAVVYDPVPRYAWEKEAP